MVNKLRKDNQGFTIIEVLIVLAIAGLIMLIVFLAVPALQRNQRNNARNSDASRVATAVGECLSNRNGQTDECNETDEIQVGDLARLETWTFPATMPVAGSFSQTDAEIFYGERCADNGSEVDTAATDVSSREFVVLYQLEPDVDRCING